MWPDGAPRCTPQRCSGAVFQRSVYSHAPCVLWGWGGVAVAEDEAPYRRFPLQGAVDGRHSFAAGVGPHRRHNSTLHFVTRVLGGQVVYKGLGGQRSVNQGFGGQLLTRVWEDNGLFTRVWEDNDFLTMVLEACRFQRNRPERRGGTPTGGGRRGGQRPGGGRRSGPDRQSTLTAGNLRGLVVGIYIVSIASFFLRILRVTSRSRQNEDQCVGAYGSARALSALPC